MRRRGGVGRRPPPRRRRSSASGRRGHPDPGAAPRAGGPAAPRAGAGDQGRRGRARRPRRPRRRPRRGWRRTRRRSRASGTRGRRRPPADRPRVGFTAAMPLRAAGTRPEPAVSVPRAKGTLPCGDHHRRARARPARHPAGVPEGVAGAVGRAGADQAGGELVEVGGADRQGAGRHQPGDDRGVGGGGAGGVARAARGGGQAGDVDVALHRERDAPERPVAGALGDEPGGGGPQVVGRHLVDPRRGLRRGPGGRSRLDDVGGRPPAVGQARGSASAERVPSRMRARRGPVGGSATAGSPPPTARCRAGLAAHHWPGRQPSQDTVPPCSACTATSIFIASSTATRSPGATTSSPSATATLPTLAANGRRHQGGAGRGRRGVRPAAPRCRPRPAARSTPGRNSPLAPSRSRSAPNAARWRARNAAMSSALSARNRRCSARSNTVSSTRTTPARPPCRPAGRAAPRRRPGRTAPGRRTGAATAARPSSGGTAGGGSTPGRSGPRTGSRPGPPSRRCRGRRRRCRRRSRASRCGRGCTWW